MQMSISTYGYLSKQNENANLKRCMYPYVQCIIYNRTHPSDPSTAFDTFLETLCPESPWRFPPQALVLSRFSFSFTDRTVYLSPFWCSPESYCSSSPTLLERFHLFTWFQPLMPPRKSKSPTQSGSELWTEGFLPDTSLYLIDQT